MGWRFNNPLVMLMSVISSDAASRSSNQRVCLLTGAGGRLGTSFCRECAALYQIVAVVRSRKPSDILAGEYQFDPLAPNKRQTRGVPILEIVGDLTHPGTVERVVETTLAEFGHIDLLVNAAGMALWGDILDCRVVESALGQVSLNALVPLQLAAEVAKRFWADRPEENRRFNRNIINISSSAGVYVYPDRGQSVYAASKAALNHITCHMASEFAAIGVRANALAPDAFPFVIPTEVVAEHIRALDEGDVNGEIVVLPALDVNNS